jgi:formyltetrahydrofolate deformylase
MPTNHRLLIACPDEVGLVYRITGVLFRGGFNIVSNHEFVDQAARYFFMRTEFAGPPSTDGLVDALRAALPPTASVRLAPSTPRSIVLLATKEAHCLGDLLLRHDEGELAGTIAAVVSNYAALAPLVARFGIPFHHVSHEGRARAEHEAEMLGVIERYEPELLVLAKYMRVLSTDFVARYAGRIVNIHHSFLPAFVGARPYQQAWDRGVKIIGATAHIVTDELDTGPILAQGVLPVTHAHTAADMAQAGRDVEKIVLARGVALLLDDRVFVQGNRTVVFE